MSCNSVWAAIILCLSITACDSNDHSSDEIDYNVVLNLDIESVIHVNLNTGDYEKSRSFYETLGFVALLDVEESVAAEQAAALAMPPYDFHASTMLLDTGLIDLMQWQEPHDASPPYNNLNHLGFASVAMITSDLDADIVLLENAGATLVSEPVNIERYNENIRFSFLKDTDGVAIELIEVVDETASDPEASSHITRLKHVTINCRDIDRSLSFYKMLGFVVESESLEGYSQLLASAYDLADYDTESASMILGEGMGINLVKWNEPYDDSPPYEKLNHLGLARIALETTDIEEDFRKLTELGIEFYSEPTRTSGVFSSFIIVFFEDPDGNVIELVEL